MSISESVFHYKSGTLMTLPDNKLSLGLSYLDNKISYLEMVIKEGGSAPGTVTDLRSYKEAREEIARLLEKRESMWKVAIEQIAIPVKRELNNIH